MTENDAAGNSRAMALGASASARPVAHAGEDRRAGAADFAGFYDEHAEAVWRTVARMGVEAMQLEDAVQEVFVTAWRRRADFAGRSSPRTWVIGIALNVAAHHRRAHGRRGTAEPLDEELAASGPGPEQAAVANEGLALLQRVLGTLSDEQREVFVLIEMEGLSAPEVSEALGASVNTIYSRLRLARAAFNRAVVEVQGRAR